MSDAVQMLEEQHAEATALFMKLQRLTDPVICAAVFRTLNARLRDHAAIEEKIFYPAFRERARGRMQADEVREALHEHQAVKSALEDLEKADPKSASFKSKLATLRNLVEHHVREEEREMLPQARRLFTGQQLEELAFRMTQLASLHSPVYEMTGPIPKAAVHQTPAPPPGSAMTKVPG
jgi:iron-sulfur cluster repair protein YtfE (RIC family)